MPVLARYQNQNLVVFNPGFLVDKAQKAFVLTAHDLGEKFKEIIQRPGAFAGFPQDIVDTGELLRQQKLVITRAGEARYEWGTEYAIFVHEGYTLRDGGTQPGRPWTKLALREINLPQVYARHLDRLLGPEIAKLTPGAK